MKKLLLLACAFFLFPTTVLAIYDPLSVPNNRYGIHIVDTNDIAALPPLLNSTGGDWGYVTMVLSDSDRDHDRWQNIFNQMRRDHLIPIIRLATHPDNAGNWARPQKDRFYELVNLLNSLNWPTENRYVILYNEPNHGNEWGGSVDPADYADTFVQFAKALKAANPDFFILPAGLDASSESDSASMDEASFLTQMIAARPEMLTLMDGWTSHSYPNPGFSGSPTARGRGTLATFDWELSDLASMGLSKTLPVFITETGWEHAEGKTYEPGLLTANQVATDMNVATSAIWTDPRIVAITPFIFNYQDVPFDHFSWETLGGGGFYPQYASYQQFAKTAGTPKQHEAYKLLTEFLPEKLVAGSTYAITGTVQNVGQGILSPDAYVLNVTAPDPSFTSFTDPLPTMEPNAKGRITMHVKTPKSIKNLTITVSLRHNGQDILIQSRTVHIVPPPTVEVHAQLGWRKTSSATDARILVYTGDTLLQEFNNLTLKNGVVSASGIMNVVPGHTYRIVTLVPGYLPRQTVTTLSDATTIVKPKRFYPLDFDGDGKFTVNDMKVLLIHAPWPAILKFFGP